MAGLLPLAMISHFRATRRREALTSVGVAVAATASALLITLLLPGLRRFPFVLPLAAIAVAAIAAGTIAGWVSLITCLLVLAAVVLGSPLGTELLGLLAFIAAGGALAWACGALRAGHERYRRSAQSSEAELESVHHILNSLGEGVCALDVQGRVTFVSAAAERILGRPSADLCGKLLPARERLCDHAGLTRHSCSLLRGGHNACSTEQESGLDRPEVKCRCWPLPNGGSVIALGECAERRVDGDRLIAEANRQLSESIDYDATLHRIAELATRSLGTWCAVVVLDAQRRPRVAAVETTDPDASAGAQAAATRWAIDLTATHGVGRVLRTGEQDLVRDTAGAELVPQEVFGGRSPRSFLAVPLCARGELLGAIAFADSERHFDDPDVGLAEELAQRCAIALDNAILHRTTEDAKRAREEILAIVSHDLRNPLSVMTTSAGLLGRPLPAGCAQDVAHKVSRVISRSAARMNRLVEDLLDFGSIESGKLSIVRGSHDAAAMVRDVIETFQPAAEERAVKLVADLPCSPLTVECDRDRVLQALSNLLSNALHVTPDGQSVIVSARIEAGLVVFAVHDFGPGIPEHDRPHLFDRYWRGESGTYKGSGLGLAITKNVVELHGGTIWVESKAGEGSTFSFGLPALESKMSADVLLVEDDPSTRESIGLALRLQGYGVAMAANGLQAWEELHRSPPPYLILLDVMMPLMNGAELLELLHADAKLRTIPVVVVSAFGSIAAPVAARSQGYLSKPINFDDLIAVSARFCQPPRPMA